MMQRMGRVIRLFMRAARAGGLMGRPRPVFATASAKATEVKKATPDKPTVPTFGSCLLVGLRQRRDRFAGGVVAPVGLHEHGVDQLECVHGCQGLREAPGL